MELPLTFADFAATEIRFRKHFRVAPQETWNDKMVPLASFLKWLPTIVKDCFPYIWSVNRDQQLMRLLVALPIVESCEDRLDFWSMLRTLAASRAKPLDRGQIEADVRREMTGRIAAGIMQLFTGERTAETAVGCTCRRRHSPLARGRRGWRRVEPCSSRRGGQYSAPGSTRRSVLL